MPNAIKILIGEINGLELDDYEEHLLIADEIPFDDTITQLGATQLQSIIEALSNKTSSSASPGFSLGRAGNASNGTWLLRPGNVPSNKTGIPMSLVDPVLKGIAVGNEAISTFDVEIYEHEGNSVNLTLLTTVSVINARTTTFAVNVPATSGRQLAARIVNGSAKNSGVDLQLSGASS